MGRIALALFLAMTSLSWAQKSPPPSVPVDSDQDVKLPDGRTQSEELLKLDYKRSLGDAASMAKLAEEVSGDLAKSGEATPVNTLKKLDDIDRLAKTIRNRLQLPKSQNPAKPNRTRNADDAAAMAKLAEGVNEDLEKDGRFVVSLDTSRKLDDIQRLTKIIRGRLKKY